MNREQLREAQGRLKQQYRDDPSAAVITLRAAGSLGEGVTCSVDTGRAVVRAGLHPATGGSGLAVCSGDMLLQALVACAGVTLSAVVTSMGLTVRNAAIEAAGDLDVRGTLGVDRDAPVGFREIRLTIDLDGDLTDSERAKAIELTERYCVVLQTLVKNPVVTTKAAGT